VIPRRLSPDDNPGPVLALIREAFAFMDGRIDPPSSMHRLSAGGIARQVRSGEIWVIGEPALACVFLTPKPAVLYLGKLAVAPDIRGRGYGRLLVEKAAERACVLGLPALELETRVELAENHAFFRAMGFAQIAATAHPGFDRVTSLTFSKRLD
jgi:GNAT superfamily N-acetyltransferase